MLIVMVTGIPGALFAKWLNTRIALIKHSWLACLGCWIGPSFEFVRSSSFVRA